MKYFILSALVILLFSCANNSSNAADENDSSGLAPDSMEGTAMAVQEQKMRREQYYIWDVDADQKTITKNPNLQPEYFHVDTLIAGLNEKYPEIKLEKRTLRHDTLYTEIKNADYFTNQMGSLGSEQYIAQVVLNLTAVEGVRFVRIDFQEGSHAAPDVWSREQFAGYREKEEVDMQ